MELFYVSFLVIIGFVGPPTGWMQFDQPFDTKLECETYIDTNWSILQETLQHRLTYQEIKSLQCKTKAEVRELNIELGHPGVAE